MPIYSKVDSVNLFAFQAGLLIQLCDEIHLLLTELYGEGANALEMYSRHAAFALQSNEKSNRHRRYAELHGTSNSRGQYKRMLGNVAFYAHSEPPCPQKENDRAKE